MCLMNPFRGLHRVLVSEFPTMPAGTPEVRPLKKEVKEGWRRRVQLSPPELAGLRVSLGARTGPWHCHCRSIYPQASARQVGEEAEIRGPPARLKRSSMSTLAITVGMLFYTRGVPNLAPKILSTQHSGAESARCTWIEFICINYTNERKNTHSTARPLGSWIPKAFRTARPSPEWLAAAGWELGAGDVTETATIRSCQLRCRRWVFSL